MQIGVFTAGDLQPSEIVTLAIAAEEAGLDVFAVGEHHNPPYNSSCPATLLAHIAARTTLRLSTATTLITTNDPARLAAEYATLALLAPARTDLVLGRGNTARVFGWFGKEIEYSLPLTVEHYLALKALWPDRPYLWHACTRSPEIADLAAEHDDGRSCSPTRPSTSPGTATRPRIPGSACWRPNSTRVWRGNPTACS